MFGITGDVFDNGQELPENVYTLEVDDITTGYYCFPTFINIHLVIDFENNLR